MFGLTLILSRVAVVLVMIMCGRVQHRGMRHIKVRLCNVFVCCVGVDDAVVVACVRSVIVESHSGVVRHGSLSLRSSLVVARGVVKVLVDVIVTRKIVWSRGVGLGVEMERRSRRGWAKKRVYVTSACAGGVHGGQKWTVLQSDRANIIFTKWSWSTKVVHIVAGSNFCKG